MPKATIKKKRTTTAAKKTAPKKIKKSALKKIRGGAVASTQPMGWIMGGMPDGFDRVVSRSFFKSFTPSFSGGGGFGTNRARSGR